MDILYTRHNLSIDLHDKNVKYNLDTVITFVYVHNMQT